MSTSEGRIQVSFTTHIFKEGDAYVVHVPELDVSSCGASPDEARRNIHDAVRGFLETCDERGNLNEILEEAGYQFQAGMWSAPELVSLDHDTLTLR